MKATITLTPEEVKELITKHLQSAGHSVDKIELNAKNDYEDRPGGSSYPVFDNVEITIEI